MLELPHIPTRNITASNMCAIFTVNSSTFQCHVRVYHYIIYLIFIFHLPHTPSSMVKCVLNLQPDNIATENAHRQMSLLSWVGRNIHIFEKEFKSLPTEL
jgi:hypothetical protein